VADETLNRIGAILEQLGARFDLVIEAVTGFGGKMDSLRGEISGQFSEVGRQIRFISDRIAENREANAVTRADLGAEMVRLGEMLGATRVEFREQLGAMRRELSENAEGSAVRIRETIAAELTRGSREAAAQLKSELAVASESLRKELAGARGQLGRELPALTEKVREELSASSTAIAKKVEAELKQTNKTLTSLTRKFERFDDRITVETRDQEQRLRKLERRTASR
jgi:hypothetical protein